MSTLAKTKKPARKIVARRGAPPRVTLVLPPAKATAGDLLRSLKDGSFDAAASKGDWAKVESAYKGRASSHHLRK